jgi:PAS domain S-box-containing protein
VNHLGTYRHSDKSDGKLASGAVDIRGHLKHAPDGRQRSRRKTKTARSADLKDQLLCKLELQQTISAEQIRALKNARRELEESRNAFAIFYHQSPIAYVTFNRAGYVVESNRAAMILFGLEQEPLRRFPFSFFVHREDAPKFFAHLGRCRNSNEERVATQLQLRRKNQELVRAELISVPVNASREGFLTAIVDLTERSRTEHELAEAKEFSEGIVETVSQPLVVMDADLRIISVNRAFTEFFKQSENYLRGRVLDAMLNLWWSGNRLRDELEKVAVRNQPMENFQLQVEPRGVGKRVLLLNARRLYNKPGSPPFILMAMEDITARQQAEEQLRNVNQQLEERVVNRTDALQKSYEQMEAFCYSIAHDLRAPLRSMTGFSTLLLEEYGPRLDERARDYTERIHQSAERMDRLIQDLLNYGRLNTAKLEIQDVNVDETFHTVLRHHEQEIKEKHAEIAKRGTLPRVRGHPVVLQAVFVNLFSNAMKFVPPGVDPKITVRSEDRGMHARIWIEDNGIGIPAADRAKIFGVFERLHSADRFPGTGIGLAIVHKGVERMGGRVGVDSEPGKGSRFWIELRKQERAHG